ncbi:MAG TPA: ABC transporter permease subunit/CPBP intramembrane protease [Longimicrobium sp.]|jgi:sodium transport system permease protein|uniref:ABC transporter permease subunit/CPBP intramembrane protease n=1 Tax=Longimicrobium sp. TaxID=2029185 RepID=UPI002EDBA4C5
MRWATVRTVLAKELRETLRDRRTLFMMLVIPTLLYPAMMVLAEQLALFGQRRLGAEQARVAVTGADVPLVRFLDADSAIRVISAESASVDAVRQGDVDAALVIGAAGVAPGGDGGTRSIALLYDASNDRSQRAQGVTRERLDEWGDSLLSRRLRARGLPAGFATPIAVADSSVATAEEAGGYALGRFLPLILVMMTLLGAFYPAIDLAAGEKERGTLETLLTAAVPAREIVAGKFAAVALIGIVAAAANLLSMLLTFQSGVFRFARAANVRFTLPLESAALILLALVPLAVLFSALFLGIAVRAQSFKEAQNALTPAQLAAILPVLVVTLPGIDFTPALAVVPVVGIAMFFRELMAGEAPLVPSLLAFAATIAYAALALAYAARAFGREDVLFGGGAGTAAVGGSWGERLRTWRAAPRGVPLPAEALAFIALVALLYFHLGTRLQADLGERGLLVSQWLLLALPAVAFTTLGPYQPRNALALRAPAPRALVAALLIALGGIPVGWLIGWLQLQMFEGGMESLGYLEKLLTATDARRAMWLFFLAALTPAICEELVFRGVLLQSLGREMRAWRAIVVTAAVFGAFHLSFETALRFLPTAWVGLLMGYVAWHSRSIFASMLMHFANNAFVVLLLWQPGVRRAVLSGGSLSWPLVAGGVVLLAAGIWLLPRRDPEPEPQGLSS